jgi:hypothetical protein
MKRFIAFFAFFWVFIVVLGAIPANSFADRQCDQQSNRPLVFRNQGAITGLAFPFASPLQVDLTDIDLGIINVVYAEIATSGREVVTIYPKTKDYYCNGDYDSGTIHTYNADGSETIIPMVSASLDEHYTILYYEYRLSHPFDHTFTDEIYTTSLTFKAVLGEKDKKDKKCKKGETVNFTMVVKDGVLKYAGTR